MSFLGQPVVIGIIKKRKVRLGLTVLNLALEKHIISKVFADVAQLAEAQNLKFCKCGFESHRQHKLLLNTTVYGHTGSSPVKGTY